MTIQYRNVRHEKQKEGCDANVLKLLTSQSVTVADCSLFGCGTYGIYAEDAAVLTVTGTEIYECTDGIVYLFDTSETTFENCRFHDNDGMFFLLGDTQAEVMKSEISLNKGELLQGYNNEAFDRDAIRINFIRIVCSGEIMRWEIQRIGPVLLLKPATFPLKLHRFRQGQRMMI